MKKKITVSEKESTLLIFAVLAKYFKYFLFRYFSLLVITSNNSILKIIAAGN